jgi:hypothetical protein
LRFGSVATGYGQPPSTIYDWALEPASLKDADYRLPDDLAIRLRIEKFCDRVTKALYSSKPEPADFISAEKLLVVQVLESELRDMDVEFDGKISGKLLSHHSQSSTAHTRIKQSTRFIYVRQNCTSDTSCFWGPTHEATI